MEPRLLYLVAVLCLGVAAQWLSWRLRMPAILVLLVLGLVSGEFANPDDLIGRELLFPFVSLSVAVILFEGGLSLRFQDIRDTGHLVLRLVTVGLAVSWVLASASAWLLLGFDPSIALLLGAVLVISGPTVIVPLVQHVRPVRHMGSLIKWEGIVNDPIGAVLAVLVLEAVIARGYREAAAATAYGLLMTIVVATTLGLLAAGLLVQLVKRYWIPDYLESPTVLATAVGAFAASNALQSESGLMAVTVLGIALANQRTVTLKHVIEFKENLRVLLISTLFILLAARLHVGDLLALGAGGAAFVASLFLIRPLAVFVSTLGTSLSVRERLFLSAMHPRGIVAASVTSLFALKLADVASAENAPPHVAALAGQAEQLVPAIFAVVVGTVTVYGLAAGPLARWLKVADSNPQGILFAGANPVVRTLAAPLHELGYQVLLVDTNQRHIAAARLLGLPTTAASILSEYAREEIDLGGIGRLLAMTPNDEVNALATMEFTDLFGRAEVYQLPSEPTEKHRQRTVSRQIRARWLFSAEATYNLLHARIGQGAAIRKTTLTAAFTYADFRARYGPAATVLFIVQPNRNLVVCSTDREIKPAAGQTLISLVDPDAESSPAAAEAPAGSRDESRTPTATQ